MPDGEHVVMKLWIVDLVQIGIALCVRGPYSRVSLYYQLLVPFFLQRALLQLNRKANTL